MWYRRGLAFDPGAIETRANLGLVERQLGLDTSSKGRTLGTTWLEGVGARVAALPGAGLLLLAVLLQTAGIVGLALAGRRVLRPRWTGPALAAFVTGAGLAIVPIRDALRPHGAGAVVIRADARLMNEPHRNAAPIAVLPLGATLEIVESSSRWARVVRGSDSGWTEQRNLEPLAWPGHRSPAPR